MIICICSSSSLTIHSNGNCWHITVWQEMPRISRPVTGNDFADVMFKRYHAELGVTSTPTNHHNTANHALCQSLHRSHRIVRPCLTEYQMFTWS